MRLFTFPRFATVLCLLASFSLQGADRSISLLKKDLRKALAAGDAKLLGKTVAGLRTMGGEDAVKVLFDTARKVKRADESVYWLLVDGIASFGDEEALAFIGASIVKHAKTPAAHDILFALGRNSLSTKCTALFKVIEKGPERLALSAVRQLATIRVPEAVDALIKRLKETKERDKELRRHLSGALTNITGQRFGHNAASWEAWWAGNRSRPLTGKAEEGRTTGTVLDELDEIRQGQIVGLEKMPKRHIVVIKGKCKDWKNFDHNFDHIEHLLARMQLPHTVITKEDFEAGFKLNQSMVVCINCMMWREHCRCPNCKPGDYTGDRLHRCTGCNVHDSGTYQFSGDACERIKKFVERGGYLFTEDWVLEELLVRIYPDLLAAGPMLKDADVKAYPAPGATSHPLMEGVFRHGRSTVVAGRHRKGGRTTTYQPEKDARKYYARSRHRWKIDLDSPSITIRKKNAVTALLRSPLVERMAKGNGALAVTFKPGKGSRSGVVLHILSHFGKQTSQDAEFGIQNLLVNFLIDANLNRGRVLTKAAKKR